MKIYFRFLNDWIAIDNETDTICGLVPSYFIEFIDKNIPKDEFVEIYHNNKCYSVHYSNIQWCN